MSDNRRSIRIRTDARVDVASDTEVLLFHKIRDLGEGGMSVEFPTLEPLGTLVDLSISLPGFDATLECTGEVVRASEEPVRHLGIRFRDLTAEQADLLRRYLASRNGTGEGR
jgi:hypothetical protein